MNRKWITDKFVDWYVVRRFDLMYGVTESEKFNELPPVAILHGLLDTERDQILRDHVKVRKNLV